ncbi:MAG: hypothetical protein LIP02_08845 [Bacteroidales bacterium]|nr:hypothetical protein [Bacteroidales bacterium]
MSVRKKIELCVGAVVVAAVGCIIACYVVVSWAAKGRLYDDVAAVPHRTVGVVLGTSPVSTCTTKIPS